MEKAIRAGGNNRQRSREVMNEKVEQSPFHIHKLIFLVFLWIGFYRIIFFRMLSPNHLFSNSRAAEGRVDESLGRGGNISANNSYALSIGQPCFCVKQKMKATGG
jgi:hypothetical protein